MPYNKLDIKVRPTREDRNWEVLESFTYKGIQVPRGFTTDGASVPKYLRNIFPHGGRKFAPAVLHDLLYRSVDHNFSREEADKLFLDAMVFNGVGNIEAKVLYLGVKYFGFLTWNKIRREV